MKIALTGSSTGIGRALAEKLLAQGHHVWGIARSVQKDLAAAYPGKFDFSTADVGQWEQVEIAARAAATRWEQFDALIACAGLQGEVGRTLRADPKQWDATVAANLQGTFHFLRAFDPILKPAAGRAKIVCFSGGGSTKARANFSAYGVAKTGVVRLVETIAAEEQGRALDINAVAPGAITTRLTDEVIAKGPGAAGQAEYDAAVKQKQSGGASMERAVGLVEFLISPGSDGITGRLISAPWDPWDHWGELRARLTAPQDDLYTLRRIAP